MSIILVASSPPSLDYWGPVVLNFLGVLFIFAGVWRSRRPTRHGIAALLYLVACLLFLGAARWSAMIGL